MLEKLQMSLPVFVQSLHYLQDGLSFPSPGDLPDSEIEPGSPALQVDSLPSEPPGKPGILLKKK